jgi:hypothetical protein
MATIEIRVDDIVAELEHARTERDRWRVKPPDHVPYETLASLDSRIATLMLAQVLMRLLDWSVRLVEKKEK